MKVTAVLVAYNSDTNRLGDILRILQAQCEIIVSDNSNESSRSHEISACTQASGGIYLSMGGNVGIAAAQNAAMAVAFDRGADAVLLLDDDSTPADDLVAVLVAHASADPGTVFGAVAFDSEGKDISNAPSLSGNTPSCREMMSSGTLIVRAVFLRVGPFDEGLFIDCVDFDWGWRAQALGIPLRLCRDAKITHRLGNGKRGGMRFPSPIRHYYQYRNILCMMLRTHAPLPWRLQQILKLPLKLLLIAILLDNRQQRLRFAFIGIRDAFRGRSGPCPPQPCPERSK